MRSHFISLFLFVMIVMKIQSASLGHSTTAEHPFDGIMTNITMADVVVSAIGGDTIEINGEDYKFGTTWTMFGLVVADRIQIHEFNVFGKCSTKGPVYCNGDKKEDCKPPPQETCTRIYQEDYKQHFCFYTELNTDKPPENLTSYFLRELATVAVLHYGGPNVTQNDALYDSETGWTIVKSNAIQNYDYNAVIIDTDVREGIHFSNYRFVETYGIMTIDAVGHLSKRPDKISFGLSQPICAEWNPYFWQFWESTEYYAFGFHPTLHKMNPQLESFTTFKPIYVLKYQGQTVYSSLIGKKILGGDGSVVEWVESQTNFTYFDPCQQKVLTLQLHQGTRNYFVRMPYRMKFTPGKPLCVVMFYGRENYGYLFETDNFTSNWKNSNIFSGILSTDYLSEVELRITTKANLTIGAIEGSVDVVTDSIPDKPNFLNLRVKTSRPLTCHFIISKNCSSIVMTTTNENGLIATKEINNTECGYWEAICRYNCQGIMGTFYPPNSVVEAPLNHFFSLETKTEIVSVGTGRQDVDHDTGRKGFGAILDKISSTWNDFVDSAKSVWSKITGWIDNLGAILSKIVYFILVVILGFVAIVIFSCLSSCFGCFKAVNCLPSCLKIFRKKGFQEFKDEEENEKMRQTTNP